MENFNLPAPPFSFFTHVEISGTFFCIHARFFSISRTLSSTSTFTTMPSSLNCSKWVSVLIASANILSTEVSGTLQLKIQVVQKNAVN